MKMREGRSAVTKTMDRTITSATKVSSVTAARDIVAEMQSESFAVLPGFTPREGHIYVRVRAISARINQNYDGFPSEELRQAYKTFLGKPCFVNHVNEDVKRRRGRVVASKYVENGDDKYIDTYMEVNAKKFPLLAKEIIEAGIDAVSMGCSAERTICSYCGNTATGMFDMCEHVMQHKGQKLRRMGSSGPEDVLVFEECRNIGFFELSFVFDPADETALASKVLVANRQATTGAGGRVWCDTPGCRRWAVPGTEGHQEWVSGNGEQRTYDYCCQGHKDQYEKSFPDWVKSSSVRNAYKRRAVRQLIGYGEVEAPAPVDTLRDENQDDVEEFHHYVDSPDFLGDPDLEKAQELDRHEEYPEGFDADPMESEPMPLPTPEVPGTGSPADNTPNGPGNRSLPHRNEQSNTSRKGSTMSRDSLAQRGRVASRARVAEDKSRNDQGEKEDTFITQTPPAEPVETGEGDKITNTEDNLVARRNRAKRRRAERLQAEAKRLLAEAQGEIPEPKEVAKPDEREDLWEAPVETQPKDASRKSAGFQPGDKVYDTSWGGLIDEDGPGTVVSVDGDQVTVQWPFGNEGQTEVSSADTLRQASRKSTAAQKRYAHFASWVRSTQGKGLRQASSKAELLRWAGSYAQAVGLGVEDLYPIVKREVDAHRKRAADEGASADKKADPDAVEEFIKNPGDADDTKESRRRRRARRKTAGEGDWMIDNSGDIASMTYDGLGDGQTVFLDVYLRGQGDWVASVDTESSEGNVSGTLIPLSATDLNSAIAEAEPLITQELGMDPFMYLSRRSARNTRTADEKLDVAAPDGRVDVERPTEGTTDEDAQQGQFDLDDYGDNAGDDIANPDLSTDQNWLPGEGKRSSRAKLASGLQAVRLAEATITAGLDENREGRWNLAQKFERLPAGVVVDRTALLERVISANKLDQRPAERKTAGNRGTSRKSTIPPNLMQAAPQQREASAEVGNPDSDIFF